MVKKKASATSRKPAKAKPAKKAAKKAAAVVSEDEVQGEELELDLQDGAEVAAALAETEEAAPAAQVPVATAVTTPVEESTTLQIRLTEALLVKLRRSAQEEGVDLQTLVHELLTEGVTLRAWEIIERKNAMRSPAQGNSGYQQNQHRGGNGNGNGNRRHNHRRGGGNGNGNGTAWMDDKAAFLEYVRNQEKRRR